MKIAVDARVLMNKKYSGVSWYAYNLLSALFAHDRQNEYVLFYNSNGPVELPKFNHDNVSYRGYRWPNKLFNFCVNFFDWPKLDELIGGCDVFLAPNLHFVSWSGKCRKVLIVHDLSFLAYPDFFNWRQRLWHKLMLKKKIINQADAIIADSQSTKKDMIDLLAIPEEKIEVAYPGAPRVIPTGAEESLSLIPRDPSIASPDGDFSRDDKRKNSKIYIMNKFGLPEKYFLFVGTIEPRKNLAGIIKALSKMGDGASLAVAGQWGWKYKEIFNFQFSISNENRIKFLGYVTEEDKVALYQNAVALVYPSFYEGFGLPILEAMSLGCPVICGNNSSQGEVLGDAGLLVNPFNVSEIKAAMELMLTDNELRNKFISRGYEQAKKFTWQKTAEQVLEIIEKLGKEKTSPK